MKISVAKKYYVKFSPLVGPYVKVYLRSGQNEDGHMRYDFGWLAARKFQTSLSANSD